MQIDKIFSTQFVDSTTRTPITNLTGVTITILEIASDGTTASVPVSNASCINGSLGFYRYYFAGMENKIYEFYFNPNDARVQITAGFVDKRLNNLDGAISEIRAGGGGFSVNYSAINNHTTSKSTELKKYIDEKVDILKENHKEIYDKVIETDSHITLAKEEVIDTIEEVKPDNSDVLKGISVIKTQNTKLATYIKTESEKEKAELIKSHERMMNDMESAYAEMEKENEIKLNNKEKLIEEMEEVSKDIVENLEGEAKKKGIETIETIKSLLK